MQERRVKLIPAENRRWFELKGLPADDQNKIFKFHAVWQGEVSLTYRSQGISPLKLPQINRPASIFYQLSSGQENHLICDQKETSPEKA
jgi:hypothetical protein